MKSRWLRHSLSLVAAVAVMAAFSSCSGGGGGTTVIVVGGGGGGTGTGVSTGTGTGSSTGTGTGSSTGTGTGSGTGTGTGVDPNIYAWFDLYGYGCATASAGPRPGCNYYWYSGQLIKIMDFEDPYFNAYYYNLIYDYYTYYLNGVLYEFTGWAWISPTGIIYDEYGNALNQRLGRGRDVIADVATQEQEVVLEAGKNFAAKYSLSEEKGIQIARALNEWANIGKDRAKTEADFKEFSMKLYGIDYNQVKNAVMEAAAGNDAAINSTIAEAARNWGTSEETMKDVLKTWYGGIVGIQ